MTSGAVSLTTNTSSRSKSYAVKATPSAKVVQNGNRYYVGRKSDGTVALLTPSNLAGFIAQDGSTTVPSSFAIISLDGHLSGSLGSFHLSSTSSTVSVCCMQEMKNGSSYYLYTEPFDIVGIPVTDKQNKITVTWKNYDGSAFQKSTFYEAEDAQGNPMLEGTPVYTANAPSRNSSKKYHYTFKGWKSSVNGKIYKGSFPQPVTSGPHKITYTAVYKKHRHKLKAGICRVCEKATKKSKVTIRKVKVKRRSATVYWTKVKGAKGYRIQWRKKGTATWQTKYVTAKRAKKKIVKLKAGKKYQFKVQAYIVVKRYGTSEKVYGVSKTKAAKTLKAKKTKKK